MLRMKMCIAIVSLSILSIGNSYAQNQQKDAVHGNSGIEALSSEREGTFKPTFAVSTNIMYWVGIMPDFKRYDWAPNASLEWFVADKWSVKGTAMYAKRDKSDNKYFGVSSYSIEPRLWHMGENARYHLYTGIYGETGDFDNQLIHIDDKRTGKFWSTGLSVGVYLPIGGRFGIELGLRGGMKRFSTDYYSIENGHYYFDNNEKKSKWGITGLNASIVYRFGKSGE